MFSFFGTEKTETEIRNPSAARALTTLYRGPVAKRGRRLRKPANFRHAAAGFYTFSAMLHRDWKFTSMSQDGRNFRNGDGAVTKVSPIAPIPFGGRGPGTMLPWGAARRPLEFSESGFGCQFKILNS